MRSSIFIICLGCLLVTITESKWTSVVKTANGPVQGEVLKTAINSVEYSSFKGIPYAEPPLQFLRFKPPVPIKPWTDVRKTIVEGSNCVQKDFVYSDKYTGSEDCLFLNVYTPKTNLEEVKGDNLLPVMVWIYGGTFKSGYGNSSLYGPDFIIEENVVLVTFNYRLGPLGFLNLNHENATGNAALKDQNLVLRWVKENIGRFGGNPNNVTLFGQSAGGVAVDFHGLSEMSAGLFHRSIAMSSSPFCPWAFHAGSDAVKSAYTLTEKLGGSKSNPEAALRTLYTASALDLVKKAEEMGSSNPPFKPSIESTDVAKDQEKFFTECAYQKYKNGKFNKVPYLTGFTADETLLFAESMESLTNQVSFASSYLTNMVAKLPYIIQKAISGIVYELQKLTHASVDTIISETSDILFLHGIDSKRDMLQSYSGHPVYFYRFSYETDQSLHKLLYNINLNGTAHGDDFAYLFHMTVTNLPMDQNDPTFITRKRMVRMWTNFAKYGNPTPSGTQDSLLQGITWPESGSNINYLDFGENLVVKKDPRDWTVSIIEKGNIIILPYQSGCLDKYPIIG